MHEFEIKCHADMKAIKAGVKETPVKAHENTEMDFDLDNNRSSIMVGVAGQK